MVSKIQTMRKEADFEITDRINVSFSGPREVVDAIDTYREYIKEETLSNAVVFEESLDSGTEWNLNGYDTLIRVQRV
jgi:isoleucyl-tRNA synthetase